MELHIKHKRLLARHTLELDQHQRSVDNCHKVLESWHAMEKASLNQELNLQKSVLRAAHASELDAMDSAIQTLGCSLEVLDAPFIGKKDRKSLHLRGISFIYLHLKGFTWFTP